MKKSEQLIVWTQTWEQVIEFTTKEHQVDLKILETIAQKVPNFNSSLAD